MLRNACGDQCVDVSPFRRVSAKQMRHEAPALIRVLQIGLQRATPIRDGRGALLVRMHGQARDEIQRGRTLQSDVIRDIDQFAGLRRRKTFPEGDA